MGLGFIFGGLGLVWGLWYLYIGLILFFGSVAGWVTESDYTEDVLPGIDPAELAEHDVPSLSAMPHHGVEPHAHGHQH
jgi:hypothetical protein